MSLLDLSKTGPAEREAAEEDARYAPPTATAIDLTAWYAVEAEKGLI